MRNTFVRIMGGTLRTTKRFTPRTLERFEERERGIGRFENYQPWHQITRSDPASHGRSHLVFHEGRFIHLLSDKELIVRYFIQMLPNLIEVREQQPLCLYRENDYLDQTADLNEYGMYPGTLEISETLKVKHPSTHDAEQSLPWRMSTDFLVLQQQENMVKKLAISVKAEPWTTIIKSPRMLQLMEIEREYWRHRDTEWLLITPETYDYRVGENLRRTAGWVLQESDKALDFSLVGSIVAKNQGRPLSEILQILSEAVGDIYRAQVAFWQCVWNGQCHIRLTRGWRPSEPVEIISPQEFENQNPVLSGRSAWK